MTTVKSTTPTHKLQEYLFSHVVTSYDLFLR